MQSTASTELKQVTYNDEVVRAFIIASIAFGVVGLLLGVIVAAQLVHWQLNFGVPWLSFGRLRPLHTNAAIFAFVGNMMFAGIYYSMQRLLKTRLASDALSWVHFWGWQLIIASAAISLPLGLTQGKEYAELIWPIDIAVALVWVVFSVNFFWTLARRNEPNLYVAIWFYIATVVTIPVLYIVNNLAVPTGLLHSYSLYGGVQDALVQWWYGHNAVGFFLTTPILGIMYYFVPKAADRPVYSYRLSVVHFWSLVFVYIWAGPHHLLNSALPDWAQTLGMVFSLMLWAPSWGGMLNGLLTLRGAWDRLRTDPVLKFFAAGVTFYGMSTFEGPLLSIRSVNALGHYTDWIIGHVHGGTLGWNGFFAAGMFYWLVPRLWKTRLFSTRWADTHFWIGLAGILLYMGAMWVSGVNQGLYWRALDADGFLKYPDFVEGLLSARLLWQMRLIGGIFYLGGFLLMAVNLTLTMRAGARETVTVEVAAPRFTPVSVWRLIGGAPVVLSAIGLLVALALALSDEVSFAVPLAASILVAAAAYIYLGMRREGRATWHQLLEGRPLAFTILTLVAILLGGIAELVPAVVLHREVPATAITAAAPAVTAAGMPAAGAQAAAPPAADAAAQAAAAEAVKWQQQPYSPLELEGRDIYVREGCYNCHSQMIRPFRHETLRYGEFARAGEYRYDHPFQWGSKRTGPDLHREGGKYPDLWHYQHLSDPRSTSPGSNMPAYAWLTTRQLDPAGTRGKLLAMKKLGVPYTGDDIARCVERLRSQGDLIVAELAKEGVTIDRGSEMVALIAYLQRLGRGPRPVEAVPAAATPGASASPAPAATPVPSGGTAPPAPATRAEHAVTGGTRS